MKNCSFKLATCHIQTRWQQYKNEKLLMNKSYLIVFITLLNFQVGFTQNFEIERKSHQIIENRAIYLNGGLNATFGGSSRTYLKIDLPPNTVEWYYSFSTSKGKSGTKNLGLAIQLTGLLADPSGITSSSLSAINVPEGEASADIYLCNRENISGFLDKVELNGGTYQYVMEGTVTNTKQAVVKINDVRSNTWYLGLKNPSTTSGLNINIEVVAITEIKKIIEKSDSQQKAELYTNLGWAQFESGNYIKCIEYCDRANAESEIGIAYANKGLSLLMLGKESDAMDTYIKAITIIKKQSNSIYYLKGALQDIDNALKLNPNLKGAKEIRQVISQL